MFAFQKELYIFIYRSNNHANKRNYFQENLYKKYCVKNGYMSFLYFLFLENEKMYFLKVKKNNTSSKDLISRKKGNFEIIF